MNRFFRATISVVLLCGLLIGAHAQESNEAMEQLLQDVREQAESSAIENRQREQVFSAEQSETEATLNELTAALQDESDRGTRLRNQFDDNEVLLAELNDTLRVRTGDMGELFGVFRQMAADTGAIVDTSLVSVEIPERRARANELTSLETLPVISDLRALQLLLLEEMIESGNVSRFQTEISDANGLRLSDEVVRIGLFNAVSADGYLNVDEDNSGLSVLPRQPAKRYADSAKDFFAASAGNTTIALDPSRGSLLSLVIQSPGLIEQATYGGGIGYTILAIGLAGFVIALWQIFRLRAVSAGVSRQLGSDSVSTDNPLGRVLSVAAESTPASVDVLERRLDEAVLRETPVLERYQGIVKVIAGVAPLMGLLGTVVGMIRTFQTITLFGAGDPKLMADGISQALVTTVEGLIVAIPLVFLHALMSDKSREMIEILEEQSAGIIARHTEAGERP